MNAHCLSDCLYIWPIPSIFIYTWIFVQFALSSWWENSIKKQVSFLLGIRSAPCLSVVRLSLGRHSMSGEHMAVSDYIYFISAAVICRWKIHISTGLWLIILDVSGRYIHSFIHSMFDSLSPFISQFNETLGSVTKHFQIFLLEYNLWVNVICCSLAKS